MARKKKQQAATGEMQATTESPKDQTDLLSAALRGLRLENVASQTATDDKAPRTQRIHTDNNGNDTKKSSQQHQLQSEPPISSRTRSVTKARTDGLKPVKKTIKMHSQPKQFLLPRPRPTPQYLQQASQPPRLTEEPRRLLIILDLNGTLVHRKGRHVTSSFTKRPHCKDFIKYVMSEHDVMIWSSAREHNVERLCQDIFAEVGIDPPVHRWHRGQFGLSKKHYEMNIQLYKQLSWVWNTQLNSPTYRRPVDQSNTVLIDDSSEKALSEPYNLIRVDEYDGTDNETDVLGKVVEYLEQARRCHDVSCYIRDTPFTFNNADKSYTWPKLERLHQEEHGGVAL